MNPDDRLIERWLPGHDAPSVHRAPIDWRPDSAVAALTIDVAELFWAL